jgi:hypothetical protein
VREAQRLSRGLTCFHIRSYLTGAWFKGEGCDRSGFPDGPVLRPPPPACADEASSAATAVAAIAAAAATFARAGRKLSKVGSLKALQLLAGLADGLAPKSRRYAAKAAIRPK